MCQIIDPFWPMPGYDPELERLRRQAQKERQEIEKENLRREIERLRAMRGGWSPCLPVRPLVPMPLQGPLTIDRVIRMIPRN